MDSIYIYGASGHGLVVADIAKACGYKNILFVDDGIDSYPNFLEIDKNTKIPFVLGVGENSIREKLFKKVEKHEYKLISLVHPSVILSENTQIGKGSIVMPQVVINSETVIGKGVILNSACVIEHENKIENFVHISPHVSLAGNVHIGHNTHIGIGSTVIQGITIGENSIIGAGAVVVSDIQDNCIAYGNPCRVIRKLNE